MIVIVVEIVIITNIIISVFTIIHLEMIVKTHTLLLLLLLYR